MTVHIGWWAIPALITLATLVWGLWPDRSVGYGTAIVGAFQLMVGIIVSLTAWLIWALT